MKKLIKKLLRESAYNGKISNCCGAKFNPETDICSDCGEHAAPADDMDESLWDNIHAKRKRGEKPAKPGDDDYPEKDAWKKAQKESKLSEGDNGENYMFWQNLKTMKHAIEELMTMDEDKVNMLLSDGHGWALDHIATSSDDIEEVYHFIEAKMANADVSEGYYGSTEDLNEAEYQGKEVKLSKPMRGDVKKYKVYVKNDKGNVVKVNFGDKNMEIKRDDPERRKSFRARHNCSDPGPKWKARYWSCKFWSTKSVSDLLSEEEEENNPWAICTASVGREDKEKYEACVKSVKAQNKK